MPTLDERLERLEKMVESISSMVAQLIQHVGLIRSEQVKQGERFEERMAAVERRLDSVEQRLDSVEQRLDSVEQRLDSVEQRLEAHEAKLDQLARGQQALEAAARELAKQTAGQVDQLNRTVGRFLDQIDKEIDLVFDRRMYSVRTEMEHEFFKKLQALTDRVDVLETDVARLKEGQRQVFRQ